MRYFVLYFSELKEEEEEEVDELESIASRLPAAAMFGLVEISAEADADAAEEEEEEAKAAPGEANSGLLLGVVGSTLFAAGLGSWRA